MDSKLQNCDPYPGLATLCFYDTRGEQKNFRPAMLSLLEVGMTFDMFSFSPTGGFVPPGLRLPMGKIINREKSRLDVRRSLESGLRSSPTNSLYQI